MYVNVWKPLCLAKVVELHLTEGLDANKLTEGNQANAAKFNITLTVTYLLNNCSPHRHPHAVLYFHCRIHVYYSGCSITAP